DPDDPAALLLRFDVPMRTAPPGPDVTAPGPCPAEALSVYLRLRLRAAGEATPLVFPDVLPHRAATLSSPASR
ncbi:MAG: hypothetical protein R3247_17985, partial [Rhodothermales bacterium]|nr:hypothetical protein [Rhodothermales bacterium]